MISPNIVSNSPKIGNTPFLMFLSSLSLLLRYLEVNIINDSLVNSLGWIPKLPIPNQLRLPFLIVPMPGIYTKIKSKTQITNILFAFL